MAWWLMVSPLPPPPFSPQYGSHVDGCDFIWNVCAAQSGATYIHNIHMRCMGNKGKGGIRKGVKTVTEVENQLSGRAKGGGVQDRCPVHCLLECVFVALNTTMVSSPPL